jgi:hypothetical protein
MLALPHASLDIQTTFYINHDCFTEAAVESLHMTFPPSQNFHPARLVSARISSLLKSRRCGFSRMAVVNYKNVCFTSTRAAEWKVP